MKLFAISLLAFSFTMPLVAQTAASSAALDAAAKRLTGEQTTLQKAQTDAQTALIVKQKALQDQMVIVSKKLNDELHADKKYRGEMKTIEDLQKQYTDLGTAANAQLNQSTAALQMQVAKDSIAVDTLTPLVRVDLRLPADAKYDAKTQTWTPAPKPEEAK